jgi:hypothetical protein
MHAMFKLRAAGLAAALLTLVSVDAAAQAPVLTVHVNGTIVTIDWSTVPGATGYELQVGTRPDVPNVASVQLSPAQRPLQVNAPPGTYYLRMRGVAPGIAGPFSGLTVIQVGGGPCQPPSPPRLTANTGGGGVTFSWENVPAAAGYRIELSRVPGQTEFSELLPATATTYSRHLGVVGTFYARLTVATACGVATSPEISFTIASPTTPTGGPRTPNPPPGTLLPPPGYGPAVVQQIAAAFPGALRNSCGNNEFLYRVVQALRTLDSRWGLNYKRGHRGDMSQDIVVYNPTDRADEGESQIYLFDVIAGHCGGAPDWNWANVTDATWAARGNPACGTTFCAYWTIEPYRNLGITP